MSTSSWRRGLVPAGTVIVAVLSLAVLLPLTPPTFQNAWAVSRDGVSFSVIPDLAREYAEFGQVHYVPLLRGSMAIAWVAWVSLALFASRDHSPPARTVWVLALLGVVLTVAAIPPVLSGDALAYVAYGRLLGLYGLNPYLDGRHALAALGEPSARYLMWDTPMPYGPLWALSAAAVAKLGLSIHAELLMHKACAGIALIGTAAAGWRLVVLRRVAFGAWTPLVIALNPLLLIEGPGSGHNDIIMVGLLMWAALKSARHQAAGAAFVVGLAVAVKPIALFAVPLVVAAHFRRSSGTLPVLSMGAHLAIALAPTFVLSLFMGGPLVLAEAVSTRAAVAHTQTPLTIAVVLLAAGAFGLWRLYKGLLGTPGAWLDAWVPLALAFGVVAVPLNFPWYLTWAAAAALTLPEKHGLGATVVTTVLGVMVMWRYTIAI